MWCWTPFPGMWWIFPLMFILCMAMMFLTARALFAGRFPCGQTGSTVGRGQGSRGSGQENNVGERAGKGD